MTSYEQYPCKITFIRNSESEGDVLVTRTFEDGSPTWRQLVPMFRDFLAGQGYHFSDETEMEFQEMSYG